MVKVRKVVKREIGVKEGQDEGEIQEEKEEVSVLNESFTSRTVGELAGAGTLSRPVAKPLLEKVEVLGPGQMYFEAPDGTLVVGEVGKQQLWYRKGNNGKGMWINPKRGT